MSRDMTPGQRIESGLLKAFRKPIWRPFMKAIRQYELIKSGDSVAV